MSPLTRLRRRSHEARRIVSHQSDGCRINWPEWLRVVYFKSISLDQFYTQEVLDMLESLTQLAESAKDENDLIDFKREFSPQKKAAFWAEIVKDIVSFANTRGGVIIFGVNDDGMPSGHDCTSLYELDNAQISDQIRKYTGSDFSSFAVRKILRDGKHFPAILIERVEVPFVFTKVGTYEIADGKQKTAFSAGTIYFRHGSKSEPCTRDDLESVFKNRLEKVRSEWLGNIRKVVEAEPGSSVLITHSKNSSDTVRITNDPNAPAMRLPNLSETHPHKQKSVIKILNNRFGKRHEINTHDIQCVKFKEKINEHTKPDFVAKSHSNNSAQYSDNFIDFLENEYNNNSDYFKNCRSEWTSEKYNNAPR